MILYVQNSKDAIRNFLGAINEFGKVTGYKINTQKSLAFLYTNSERSEREIQETIPFSTTSKRIKELRDQKKYSQSKLCTKLQLLGIVMTKEDLSKIEHENKIIKDFEVWGISKALQIPMEYLFNEIEKETE